MILVERWRSGIDPASRLQKSFFVLGQGMCQKGTSVTLVAFVQAWWFPRSHALGSVSRVDKHRPSLRLLLAPCRKLCPERWMENDRF